MLGFSTPVLVFYIAVLSFNTTKTIGLTEFSWPPGLCSIFGEIGLKHALITPSTGAWEMHYQSCKNKGKKATII